MIRRWLLGLVGVRDDLIDELPAERFRYVAMAGVLLTTAAMAAVSATFALQMAVRVPIFWALLLGIGWGVIILNLDRLLVLGMTRQSGWVRNLLAAVPRLALALLLGTVISTPLVLRIFDKEITEVIPTLQQQKLDKFQQGLNGNAKYLQLDSLQKQLTKEQGIADGADWLVAEDTAVIDAQTRDDAARKKHDDLQTLATGEANGSLGTHQPGYGEQALRDQALADQALVDLGIADTTLATAKDKVKADLASQAPAARIQVDTLRNQITSLQAEKKAEGDSYFTAAKNDTGLLIRLQALSLLRKDNPDLAEAQLVLFLLFLTIEILPIFVKLLQLAGRPTVYDEVSERQQQSAKRSMLRALAFGESRRAEQAYATTQRPPNESRPNESYSATESFSRNGSTAQPHAPQSVAKPVDPPWIGPDQN